MTNSAFDIERVVSEVLAELRRAPQKGVSNAAAGGTAGLSSSAVPTVGQAKSGDPPVFSGELVFSNRLVTMAEIAGRLDGIRRVTVDPRAVVTPAVRDLLRQRNIELSRDLAEKNASAGTPRLVVVAARAKMDPKLLADALKGDGIEVQYDKTDCILAATDQLAAELAKGDTLGLLLTPHTAAALCLANRLAGVRAVLGSDSKGLETDLSAVGANLLVADPQVVGLFKLSRIAGEFVRGGIRPCPEVFKKRLS
jgi:hypothetical protein